MGRLHGLIARNPHHAAVNSPPSIFAVDPVHNKIEFALNVSNLLVLCHGLVNWRWSYEGRKTTNTPPTDCSMWDSTAKVYLYGWNMFRGMKRGVVFLPATPAAYGDASIHRPKFAFRVF